MNPAALTEMVARVFDDRYRLDELIGVGAVSAVFSAFDMAQDEWVAFKVFDASLASDERFVARLLEAAEQASVLRHPNIVEILDWGFDEGPYIVSELCEGGSLAGLLAEGHRLAPSQALIMSLECARALNHGHEQGAVHRNLTPRNVLFTADHHVRVSDYGLAKVLAEAPAAQATRALENVRYASPEQARGRTVGEASDLYSLALVVSEAVSGVAPQVSETVVGTLMDRAESPAHLDPALGGLLPPFERCGRVEPDQRPEAEELSIALLAAAEGMERPLPLPVVGLGFTGDLAQVTLQVAGGAIVPVGADESATGLADVIDLEVPDAVVESIYEVDGGVVEITSTADAVVDPPALSVLEDLEQAEPVFAEIPSVGVEPELDVPETASTVRSAQLAYEETEDDADDRLPWWPLVALVLLIAAGVAAWVYFVAFDEAAETAVTPDLVGVQFDDLTQDERWNIVRIEDRVDGATVGSIVAQNPGPGEPIESGDTLTVTVSLGNAMVEIPSDIVGLTVDQAESRLSGAGLVVGRTSIEQSETFAAGLVIGLDEPTTQKPSGEGVNLRVSSGPEDRIVPLELLGLNIGEATTLLVGLRLQAFEEATFDPEAPPGTVLATFPPGGEVVAADSAVTLFVSAGPEPVEMPDIIDLPLDQAIDVIEELGLIFIDTTGTPGEPVIGSLPPIGAIVEVGTEVTIILNDPVDDEEAEQEDDG